MTKRDGHQTGTTRGTTERRGGTRTTEHDSNRGPTTPDEEGTTQQGRELGRDEGEGSPTRQRGQMRTGGR